LNAKKSMTRQLEVLRRREVDVGHQSCRVLVLRRVAQPFENRSTRRRPCHARWLAGISLPMVQQMIVEWPGERPDRLADTPPDVR
jgi:hypothetical protein